MGKKLQIQSVISVLMVFILLISILPGIALADDGDVLGSMQFASDTDSTIITGETTNINIRLYEFEDDQYPFLGNATAIIEDSNKNSTNYNISGSQGNFTIQNVTIDTPGDYTIYVKAVYPSDGLVTAHLKVADAVATIKGSLFVNTENTLIGKLEDSDGNALPRRTITIDGSTIGSSVMSATTLSDGSFTFTMTPSLYGSVNIKFGAHVIGTILVVPAYTQNERIGGTAADNVALSVEIAENGWPQGAHTVILTRDDQFSDAMAAVPLSKVLNAPILMTSSAKLDDRALAEMKSLGVNSVYILGGIVAISQSVQDSLSSNFIVTRIAGQQGYDTAALISSYVGIGNSHTVYIANGHAIPDAIAGSAFAAEQGSAILLTEKEILPASTIRALGELKVNNVVLLGGTAVIGTQVENELHSNYAVQRFGGYDRYDTQNMIFNSLFNNMQMAPQSPLYFTSGLVRQDDVSSGKPYGDSLLTAALAAKTGGFVAMVPPNSLPSSLNYFLLFNKGYITKARVVGSNSAVSPELELKIQQLLNR